jgi:hypothetical protein
VDDQGGDKENNRQHPVVSHPLERETERRRAFGMPEIPVAVRLGNSMATFSMMRPKAMVMTAR